MCDALIIGTKKCYKKNGWSQWLQVSHVVQKKTKRSITSRFPQKSAVSVAISTWSHFSPRNITTVEEDVEVSYLGRNTHVDDLRSAKTWKKYQLIGFLASNTVPLPKTNSAEASENRSKRPKRKGLIWNNHWFSADLLSFREGTYYQTSCFLLVILPAKFHPGKK